MPPREWSRARRIEWKGRAWLTLRADVREDLAER